MNKIKHFQYVFTSIVIAVSLLVVACDKNSETSKVEVLARVENETITRKDLDFALLRLLGPEKAFQVDESGSMKVLESLVLSRAIALKARKTLTKDEIDQLQRQVRDYEEQLLVKRYLRNNVTPQPVTQSMVAKYYEKNKKRFGEATVRDYELIASVKRLQGSEREQVLQLLNEAQSQKNWQSYTKTSNAKAVEIEFRSGNDKEKLLHKTLRMMLESMQTEQTSKPFFIDGKAYVVRITRTQEIKARPLDEVSAEIRKALAPIQLQKAISSISDEIKKTTRVEYTK